LSSNPTASAVGLARNCRRRRAAPSTPASKGLGRSRMPGRAQEVPDDPGAGRPGTARNPVPRNGPARTGRESGHAQPARTPREAREGRACVFARDPDAGFADNAAERAIRMAKVKATVSGGFRPRAGAEAWRRILGCLDSMKALGYDPPPPPGPRDGPPVLDEGGQWPSGKFRLWNPSWRWQGTTVPDGQACGP